MEPLPMYSILSTINKPEYEGYQTRSNYIYDDQGVIDKSREDVEQRTCLNKLQVTIGYLLYKVNAVNIGTVQKLLLQQNMIKAKHIFCQLIIQVQKSSTKNTHVYATLVAVINLVLPEIGNLVLKKCITLFQSAYLKCDIFNCSVSVKFIGHLINHNVADEKLAVELLTKFLKEQNMFSIKIAIIILEICGKKISEGYQDILNEVFDNMFNFLNNNQIQNEDEKDLKLILELQENGFKFQQLDLVPANEFQITHVLSIDKMVDTSPNTIDYHYDPEIEMNEIMYKNLISKSQGYDSEEENGLESVTDFNNQYDGEKKLIEEMKHINDVEKDTNKLSLRKMIKLTDLMNCRKFVQKFVKYCQVDMDLLNMILDCCCEHSTYLDHFGHLTKELTVTDERFANVVKIAFIYYVTSDKLDSHRIQIITSYFVHLWKLGVIHDKLYTFMLGK